MPENEEVKEEVKQEEGEKTTAEMDEAALDALLNAEEEAEEKDEVEEVAEKEETAEVKEEEQKEEEKKELTPEEKTAKQLSDKEAFIQRQAAEIGELRKREAQLRDELALFNPADNDALYQVNPTEAVNQVLAAREKEAEIIKLNQQASIKQSELLSKEYVPDFEDHIDDMVEILKEQKVEPEFIRSFKSNPYTMPPAVLVNLASTAKLAKEVKALKAENELLKKKPDEVLKKVETAARQVVTGSTGKAGKSAIEAKQVISMSNKELDDILNAPEPD